MRRATNVRIIGQTWDRLARLLFQTEKQLGLMAQGITGNQSARQPTEKGLNPKETVVSTNEAIDDLVPVESEEPSVATRDQMTDQMVPVEELRARETSQTDRGGRMILTTTVTQMTELPLHFSEEMEVANTPMKELPAKKDSRVTSKN